MCVLCRCHRLGQAALLLCAFAQDGDVHGLEVVRALGDAPGVCGRRCKLLVEVSNLIHQLLGVLVADRPGAELLFDELTVGSLNRLMLSEEALVLHIGRLSVVLRALLLAVEL